jgi:hypothetical protein
LFYVHAPSERMRRISAPPEGVHCDLQGDGLKITVRLGESPSDLGFSAPEARSQARIVLIVLAIAILGGSLLLGLRLTGDLRPALILAIVASIGLTGFIALSFDSLGFASFVVNGQGLQVKSHPLGDSLELKVSQLDQLYCQRSQGASPNESPEASLWNLRVLLRSGQDLSLAILPRLDQALFLEEEIEEFLDIEDRPMRGEVAKPEPVTGGWRAEFQR